MTMPPVPRPQVLERFFAGLTEHAFHTRLGVADPPLTDYLSNMLVRFVRSDAIYRIRNLKGQILTEVAQMLAEADARVGDARRETHRHIGDFILFWAGLYPEALKRMRSPSRRDHLLDYCTHGKRAYSIASRIRSEQESAATSEVLQRLSDQFELCMYGLGEVRREWERRDGEDESPRPFLIN